MGSNAEFIHAAGYIATKRHSLKRKERIVEGAKVDGETRSSLSQAIDRYIKKHYVEESTFPIIGADIGSLGGFGGTTTAGTEDFCKPTGVSTLKSRRVLRSLLDAVLRLTDKTFAEKLIGLIKKKGGKASDIYAKAGITRQHFSKIKSNANYQPSKETALAFAIVLHLSLDETKDLIGSAGFTLSRSSKRDLIVEYFIKEGIYDVDAINDILYERGYAPLTNRRESKDE